MDVSTAVVLGIWAFAVATAVSKQVAGWVMVIAYSAAIITSVILL